MSTNDATASTPARKRLSLVQRVLVFVVLGAVASAVITALSVVSQDNYNRRLDETNSIRQGAIVSSAVMRGAAEVGGAQQAYGWAVERRGVAAVADDAPERKAFLTHLATVQASLKKMPIDVLTTEEKTLHEKLTAAWSRVAEQDAAAVSAYRAGGAKAVATGGAVLTGPASQALTEAGQAATALNAALNARVAQVSVQAREDADTARRAQLVVFALVVGASFAATLLLVRSFPARHHGAQTRPCCGRRRRPDQPPGHR